MTHSGRQLGGPSKKFGKQVHTGLPLSMRQSEFGPQGLGLHGSSLEIGG